MTFKRYVSTCLATLALGGLLFLKSYGQTMLDYRLDSDKAVKNNLPNKYALLISGDDKPRDIFDISFAYKTLLENGFHGEDIYIVDKTGQKKPFYEPDGIAAEENVKKILEHLTEKIDDKDVFFIYIGDHGSADSYCYDDKCDSTVRGSEIQLTDERMSEFYLGSYLKDINPKAGVVLADICYGGGFADLGKGNFIGIASGTRDQIVDGPVSETFACYFFDAFNKPESSDLDHDGAVSILEAFKYAKEYHKCSLVFFNYGWVSGWSHTPIIKSDINSDKINIK